MKTAKEIAQWVIDNRYPESENKKVSDVEMYHELVESIEKLSNIPPVSGSVCVSCVENGYAHLKFVPKCIICGKEK
jgi:hypothetical protein